MLNYEDLNTETLVARAGQTSGVTSLSMGRGNVNFGVQFCQGSTNCAAPTGAVPWFGLKAQANMQGPWLSNVQLAAIAGSAGLYQAILANNTPELIALMHADPNDPVPELLSVPVYGQFYYFLPGQTDPVASQVITVNVTAVLWNGAEGIAPSPNVLGPTVAQIPINLYGVTQRTGAAGDATALANTVTVGRRPGQLFSFTESTSGDLVNFRLATGAAAAGNVNQVAPADFNAGANNVHFALVPTGAASVVSTPRIAYLATNGNDGTAAIGNPANPYLTAQAAYNAAVTTNGPVVILVGVGTFGNINVQGSYNSLISFIGYSATSSFLGNINCNGPNGSDAIYTDNGDGTASLTHASTAGQSASSLTLTLTNVHVAQITSIGGTGGSDPGNPYTGNSDDGGATGGSGGSLILTGEGAFVSLLIVDGGQGGAYSGGQAEQGAAGYVGATGLNFDTISASSSTDDGAVSLDECTGSTAITCAGNGSALVCRSRIIGQNIVTFLSGQFPTVQDNGGNATG